MDYSECSTGSGRPSPRRELQGPRPAPLKVRKDSRNIKKPPKAAYPPQHRPPVIIYTVSPKVIHTNPSDFMSLVQRLTGPSASSHTSRAITPAAKLDNSMQEKSCNDVLDQLGFDGGGSTSFDRTAGILSPVPASLPMISPNLFSPPVVHTSNSVSFLPELSPGSFMSGNKNYADNSFLISPSNLLSSHVVPSPSGYYWDLFNQYQDL